MIPDDYILGVRHGREAHDLELEAMRDPLLADALDGFDAVPGGPGEHPAALERLAERIARSADGGRAAARSRASRLRERRIRGWSVAVASMFLAAVAGGGAWLMRDGISTGNSPTPAGRTPHSGYSEEVIEIMPPVTVIREETAPAAARNTAAAPTDLSEVRLDRREVPDIADVEAVAGAAGAAAVVSVRDTTQTAAFRRLVAERNRVRSAVTGRVTVAFEVGADGRPQGTRIVESPTPELGEFVRTLLDEGPDWPTEPSLKQITVNL